MRVEPPRSGALAKAKALAEAPTEAYTPPHQPPHITLDELPNTSPQSLERGKWIFFLILALGSAAAAFYYLWPGR